MTAPALPSPGRSWTDAPSTAPVIGYGVFVEAEPGVFELRARGTAAARAVLASSGGLLGGAFFSSGYLAAPFYVGAPATSDAYELHRIGEDSADTPSARVAVIGGAGLLVPDAA